MTPVPVHHSINYVELVVNDLETAKRFYRDAFGWVFVDYGPAYAGIASLTGDGTEVGGLLLSDQGRPPGGPLVLLYSDDLDATQKSITDAGGAVVRGRTSSPVDGDCTSSTRVATSSGSGLRGDARMSV